jgi:hypothetical protein
MPDPRVVNGGFFAHGKGTRHEHSHYLSRVFDAAVMGEIKQKVIQDATPALERVATARMAYFKGSIRKARRLHRMV